MFNGETYIYENYVRNFVRKYRPNSDLPRRKKQVLQKIIPNARDGVELYIAQHGAGAFENIIKEVRTRPIYFHLVPMLVYSAQSLNTFEFL
jgi:hypothetical protein